MTNSAPSSTDAELLVALNEDLVQEWSGFLARERTGAAVEYGKAQRQGLPDDEARQFFRSHRARLRHG